MIKTLSCLIFVSTAVAALGGCTTPPAPENTPSVAFRSVEVSGERVSLADTRYVKDGREISCQRHIEDVNTVPTTQGALTTVHTYSECQTQ
jgi:hypothetical protein